MKKLLLLEANGNAGEDLLDAARELGVEVYVATHQDVYAGYGPAVRSKITEVAFTDLAAPDNALKELAEFCRDCGVDGVITGWEFFSPLVTRLAAELGLPGHDAKRADACRNKRLMAAVFAAHGVPAPRTIVLDGPDGAAERLTAAGLTFPVVVKPAENAGSVGVSVVQSAYQLRPAIERALGWPYEFPHGIPLENTALVQEYVAGPEFSVETVIARGEMTHLAVTEKFTTQDASRAELGHTVPAAISPPHRASLLGTAEQALLALGLRNGIAHTEIKLLPDGSARIIEVGARPPGDHIMKLVGLALGISEARAYVQVALGEQPDLTPRRGDAAAIRFLASPQPGVLRRVSPIPDVPELVDVAVYLEPGSKLGCTQDNVGRLGHLIVRAGSPAEVNRAAADLLAAIDIEVI